MITLRKLALWTAFAMSAFAGIVATTGLAKFLPGAELLGVNLVFVLGALLEIGTLVVFAVLARGWCQTHFALKWLLVVITAIVVLLDIVGVSGQLSSSYQGRLNAAQGAHTASQAAFAAKIGAAQVAIADLDRQLAAQDAVAGRASEARAKAKDDKDRIKAAKAMAAETEAKRKQIGDDRKVAVNQLVDLQVEAGQTEGKEEAGGESAAVQFLAGTFGVDQDRAAHYLILVISSLPNLFAMTLVMLAEGMAGRPTEKVEVSEAPVVPERKELTKRQLAARKGWETRRRKALRKAGPALAVVG